MQLRRYDHNPVLEPTSNWWERVAVFNAAAVCHSGRVHLLYRAVGEDRISRFGLASSPDGFHFDIRSTEPVLEPDLSDPYERLGCEDPRVVLIDGTFYITYTAASVYLASHPATLGSNGAPWRVRVALASSRDFKTFEQHGVIIPDADSKNAALFPEKINGRYVLLHRILPDLWICESDDLLHWDNHYALIQPRAGSWDCSKVGAGAPPIKTGLGWLEFYHGVSDGGVYGLGVLLMDLADPRRILYRSDSPILTPDCDFEINGEVPNVVFTCGAVEKDGQYLVYYGCADRAIGVAMIDRDELHSEIAKRM